MMIPSLKRSYRSDVRFPFVVPGVSLLNQCEELWKSIDELNFSACPDVIKVDFEAKTCYYATGLLMLIVVNIVSLAFSTVGHIAVADGMASTCDQALGSSRGVILHILFV